MPQTWSPFTLSAIGLTGLAVGLILELVHRRGWYLRPGEAAPRRLPCVCIAASTALAWVLLAGSSQPPVDAVDLLVLIVRLAVAGSLVLLAAADVAVHRLPDVLTLPTAAISAAPALLGLATDSPHGHPVVSLLAGVLVPGALLLLTLTFGGIGLGDVKLAISPALLLGLSGWEPVGTWLLTSAILAGVAAVVLLLRGADRSSPLPLGPFLAVGALLAALG